MVWRRNPFFHQGNVSDGEGASGMWWRSIGGSGVAILFSSRQCFRQKRYFPFIRGVKGLRSQSFFHQGNVSDQEEKGMDILVKMLGYKSQSFFHQGNVSDPGQVRARPSRSPAEPSQSFFHQGNVSDEEYKQSIKRQEEAFVAILFSSRQCFRQNENDT